MHADATRAPSAAVAETGHRARVRRSVLLLALLAAGFYFGFIVLAVLRGSR